MGREDQVSDDEDEDEAKDDDEGDAPKIEEVDEDDKKTEKNLEGRDQESGVESHTELPDHAHVSASLDGLHESLGAVAMVPRLFTRSDLVMPMPESTRDLQRAEQQGREEAEA